MANAFQTVDWMSMKCLFLVKNKLGIASNFNTDNQFQQVTSYYRHAFITIIHSHYVFTDSALTGRVMPYSLSPKSVTLLP